MKEKTMSEIAVQKIRANREHLGVSRATLQKATGFSSSVIWRAEQVDAKPLTQDEYTKILDVLDAWMENGVPAEYVKTTKAHSAPTTATSDEWMTKTWELREVISNVHTEVLEQIKQAQAKKASTKGLKAIAEQLAEHCTACSSAEH
jgi:hypothetical protein